MFTDCWQSSNDIHEMIYKYQDQMAAVTSELANRLFHVLGKDYFMLHKILCDFIA